MADAFSAGGTLRLMSPADALLVSRYRAFEREAILPLRPLTLLYGRNNSGKSALARALAMIGASVAETPASALVTPRDLMRNGDFADLAWRGDAGDYSFDLGFRWSDGELREVRYTFDGGNGRASYVKELVLRGEGGRVLWSGVAPRARPLRSDDRDGDEVTLVGLVPHGPTTSPLLELAARMTALRGHVTWLDSTRTRPERTVRRVGITPSELSSDGANAADFLVESPDLVEAVGRFYARLSPPRDLEVSEVLSAEYRITLSPSTRSAFRIDLADTGEGMGQVLAVLVAATLAGQAGAGALLVVEEPDSHLHPDAQSVLVSYLCKIAAQTNAPTLVLETHSRVILLGVQLAVAQGLLAPERVGLAWVDQDAGGRSSVTSVELGPTGHPREGWPIAALGEDLHLARELARQGMGDRG